MLTNEAIIKILGKSILEMPELDQLKLRDILEEVLYNYEITSKCKSVAIFNDIQDKIILYLSSKQVEGLSKGSLYGYKVQLARFSFYVNKDVEKIDSMDIRMYLATISKEYNLAKTTMATIISILKTFFNWLESEEYIIKSPMRKIKQPRKPKHLRKSLTIEELEILRGGCKTLRQRALIEFMFSTGCRLSEIVNVNLNDINWNTYSLKVVGKGSKQREVFFSPKAKIYLDSYLESRTDHNEALFVTSKRPYNRLGGRSIQREIKIISQNARFNKSIYPHLLRHTMATLGLQSGASLTTIQKLLGHEDPATTEIYAEIDRDTVRGEYKKHLNQ